MTSLGDRLLAGLRAAEAARPYQIDRADIRTVDDGLVWMRGARDGDSEVWFGPHDSDHDRRRTIRRMFWMRWVHRKEWLARGGVER